MKEENEKGKRKKRNIKGERREEKEEYKKGKRKKRNIEGGERREEKEER